eukprot:6200329-Pleurochrysis_carterae.AAC.3
MAPATSPRSTSWSAPPCAMSTLTAHKPRAPSERASVESAVPAPAKTTSTRALGAQAPAGGP